MPAEEGVQPNSLPFENDAYEGETEEETNDAVDSINAAEDNSDMYIVEGISSSSEADKEDDK